MRAHTGPEDGNLGAAKRVGDPLSIPPAIAKRLAGYGITSLAQWRSLGGLRLELWGITRKTAAFLDSLSDGTSP